MSSTINNANLRSHVTTCQEISLSNNRSCIDRLNAEYYYEYSRVIHLHDQIKECLTIQHIEAIQETLDEWLNAINMLKKSMLTRN
ncbi:unnamed protein product [Rotaria sp. Silwood2]|nr:unnamed protein product [Rotaria sp. Silwood2]